MGFRTYQEKNYQKKKKKIIGIQFVSGGFYPIMTNYKGLCIELLSAEGEEEVVTILKRENLWDDPSQWAYYGGMENNWGIIGSQQAKPESALVEKLVNSVDAVLMRQCYLRNINPTSDLAPRSISDAVESFFDVKHGNLSNLSSTKRSQLSKEIGLVATGQRSEPNYIVFDRGEGQEPQKFPDTFLSCGFKLLVQQHY